MAIPPSSHLQHLLALQMTIRPAHPATSSDGFTPGMRHQIVVGTFEHFKRFLPRSRRFYIVCVPSWCPSSLPSPQFFTFLIGICRFERFRHPPAIASWKVRICQQNKPQTRLETAFSERPESILQPKSRKKTPSGNFGPPLQSPKRRMALSEKETAGPLYHLSHGQSSQAVLAFAALIYANRGPIRSQPITCSITIWKARC